MKKLDLLPSRSPRRLLSVFGILLLFAMPSAATWDEGVASFHAHDYPAAAEAFARVVERSPEAHQAHYMLGLSLLKQEQTAAARRSFEKAVASVSDSAEYRLALASTEVTLGRHDDALSTLREIDPKRVEKASHRESLATLLGKTAPRASDPAEAERIVRRGLAADGTSVPLLLAHASLAEKRGAMPERAEAYARAYLASPEEAPRLGEKAARALLNVGHGSRDETGGKAYRRAVEVTSRLVREEPGGASYFCNGPQFSDHLLS